MIRILFIGDIVGFLGRSAVGKALPRLKKSLKIDLCIANGENLAGGRGLTPQTVLEVIGYGVDYFTGGDHTFWQKSFKKEIKKLPVLRPLNLLDESEGAGSTRINLGKGSVQVSVISLLGTSSDMIRARASNPFPVVDRFLNDGRKALGLITIVDFHAETSSEKVAMGWYLDGRVTAVLGTHTHVPTCDGWVLPGGTAYITDVGMVGARDSVLGVKKEIIINRFAAHDLSPFKWVRSGPAVFNSVLLTIDEKTGRALSIERRDRVIS